VSKRKKKGRKQSILQPNVTRKNKVCYVTGAVGWRLECHHIYPGNPNRRISDENGFWIYILPELHREINDNPNEGLDDRLKKECQAIYESMGNTRDDFRKLIGKSWL
jgi:hypothetical protein